MSATGKKPQEGEQAVEHQELIAEAIAPKVLGNRVKTIADHRRDDADIWHQTVVGLLLSEESEGEESQQRPVGVACQRVDGVDQRGGVKLSEQQDEEHEEEAHGDVRLLSKHLIIRFPEDVDAEAGGQRGQGGVGTRERGRHDADDKEVKREE